MPSVNAQMPSTMFQLVVLIEHVVRLDLQRIPNLVFTSMLQAKEGWYDARRLARLSS